MTEFYVTTVIRLLLSVLIGGIIGYERENTNRPAGLRTHVLVCVGATLVMLISEYMNIIYGDIDIMRLGAQVISGIGFLGAGTIIRHGNTVRGLTTAASLWAVACVGLATGIGFYPGAIVGTVLIYITLYLFKRFESSLSSTTKNISIGIEDKPGLIGDINSVLERHNVIIRGVDFINYDKDSKDITLRYNIKLERKQRYEVLFEDILRVDGVRKIYDKNKL